MTHCPEYTELADVMARELAAEFPPGQPLTEADAQRRTSIEADRDRILGRHLKHCPTCTDTEGNPVIDTADGTQYKCINGVWIVFRTDRTRAVLADGTHTDRTTGHTTTVVGSSLTVVDRDGNKSTVMC